MKVNNTQIEAMKGQIVFILQDPYTKYNEEAVKKQEEAYATAANKVPELKAYIQHESKGRTYNPHEQSFKNYLENRFPEDFANIPKSRNLQNISEAIRREIIIVAPECKTTDEILAKVTSKYVV